MRLREVLYHVQSHLEVNSRVQAASAQWASRITAPGLEGEQKDPARKLPVTSDRLKKVLKEESSETMNKMV